MKLFWNDKVLDTDDAVANKDGSFTWDFSTSVLTYYPDENLMLSYIPQDLAKCVLPIIYRKQNEPPQLPS